jgi:hypothetical protein
MARRGVLRRCAVRPEWTGRASIVQTQSRVNDAEVRSQRRYHPDDDANFSSGSDAISADDDSSGPVFLPFGDCRWVGYSATDRCQ